MTINDSVIQQYDARREILTNRFTEVFEKKHKPIKNEHESSPYTQVRIFIMNHKDLLGNESLEKISSELIYRIKLIKKDTSGIGAFFRYLFHGDIKKMLKKEKRKMYKTLAIVETVRGQQKKGEQHLTATSPLPQRNVSQLTAVPAAVQTEISAAPQVLVQQATAPQVSVPPTPIVTKAVPQSPRPTTPRLRVNNQAAPPPPPPPAPGTTGAPPPPAPTVKRFKGEVAEPKVRVTAKELDPNRKAKEGERSPAEVRSLVEQEIVTIATYVETMKESLKPVEAVLKRSDDITTQLDNLKIIYTPIKQKINNYNKILERLDHHAETFGIQIPKEKNAFEFPVLDHELFAEVAAELQKEGKGLSLKFSAEEIHSTLQEELEALNSQFSEYEKNRAALQEELKGILNQENNGIKFSAYKTLFDSKTKTVEKWERASNNRKAFLTKLNEIEKSDVKVEEVKKETPVVIEEDVNLSPEEQAKKAKVREIVANIKKLFTIQNFAILMKAATVTPLVDLFKTTISEMTDREPPKEYNF